MQFTHPEMLWGLFLLIIPIIIHLFQLRKFRKEAFTNVALLQKIEIQTRKSSQLKKWLIFTVRMLAATALIIAFSQPFYSPKDTSIAETENDLVLYLDNSFSMQAKDNNGALLKKAIREVIEHLPEAATFTLFTNDNVFNNVSLNEIREELLALEYTSQYLSINDAILKGRNAFRHRNAVGNTLILLSDFQQYRNEIAIQKDSMTNLHFVKLSPQSVYNIAIDSVYISEKTPNGFMLDVILNRQGEDAAPIPVSLLDGDKLIAKASVNFEENTATAQARFEVASEVMINGKISIEAEDELLFDNVRYFSINPSTPINVLAINEADDNFLKRIYTEEEFNVTSVTLSTLDYSRIANQDVIVLNELKTLPTSLITTLNSFKDKGGSLVIIVSEDAEYTSYNTLLRSMNLGALDRKIVQKKKIINIAYSHPVFSRVFEKQVQNFQYPEVDSYHTFTGKASPVLQFENNAVFLAARDHSYLFTAALNEKHSNFKNSPLIVPIFYNIGKNSVRWPQLYYTIGDQNQFDIKTRLQKDRIIRLVKASQSFIPQQQAFDSKVQLTTYENPSEAGTYDVISNENTIAHVSFNYPPKESILRYHNIDTLQHIHQHSSIPQVFNSLKKENNTTVLWKWFVIFALTLLLIEFLLLKIFK